MAYLTNYFGNLVLSTYLVNKTCYLALHSSDPTAAGNAATEVIGGGYQRQQITFSAASNKTIANTTTIFFYNTPATPVTHFGIWDAATNGHLLLMVPVTPALNIEVSGTVTIPLNDLAIVLG